MTTPLDDEQDPSAQRIRDALSALPPVSPDPAYRERMRAAFTSPGLPARRRPPLRTFALAASILLAFALGWIAYASNEGSPWRIVGRSGEGAVGIDGHPKARADELALGTVVPAGARIETDDEAELMIGSDETLILVVTPGSRVILPAVPRRWFGRTLRAEVQAGELRGRTGRDFRGARFIAKLPDAEVEVTGTTFALLANAEGSCVCVFDGHVRMTERTGKFTVDPGRRRVVPPGVDAPRDEPIRAMEAMKLEMLVEQTEALWSREAE